MIFIVCELASFFKTTLEKSWITSDMFHWLSGRLLMNFHKAGLYYAWFLIGVYDGRASPMGLFG